MVNRPKSNTLDPLPGRLREGRLLRRKVSEDEHPRIDGKVSEVEHPRSDELSLELFENARKVRFLELFEDVREVRKLTGLRAGDTLVVHTEGRVTPAVSEDIQSAFKSLVPHDIKVVVCQGIRELEVIKRGEGGDP